MPRIPLAGAAETDSLSADAEELATLNQAEGGDVFRVIDEMRTAVGVAVLITRVKPDGLAYCGKMPVAEFSLDKLKAVYGAGKFRVRIQGPKGMLPGGGTVEIDAGNPESVSGGMPHPGGDIGRLMQWWDAQQKEREARRAEKWDRLLELSLPALITVLPQLFNRGGGMDVAALVTALKPAPPPSMHEVTQTMMSLKQLSAPETERESSLDTILTVMEKVKDLTGGEKSGSESTWIDIVRDLIKSAPEAIKPILEGMQAQAIARMQSAQPVATRSAFVPPAKPAIASAPSASADALPATPPIVQAAGDSSDQSGEGDVNMNWLLPMIKGKLSIILAWAKSDRDPVTYAQVFADDLPPNIAQFLPQEKALEYLRRDDWFEKVCELNPEFANFKPWCAEFRQELIEIVSMSEPQSDPPAAA